MKSKLRHREFTGRHMATVLVGGFAIVLAVNFYMASLATGGFHGVVVENSYVASQEFNSWLDEAKSSEELGWVAQPARDTVGYVEVVTENVPDDAVVTADLRRPLGDHEFADLLFVAIGDGRYKSTAPVLEGRWTIRLTIVSGEQQWASEGELP